METTTQIDYKKLFNLFVSKDELRPDLCHPFEQNGRYYATDAHALVFIDATGIELGYPKQEKPNMITHIPKEATWNVEINVAALERNLISEMIDEEIEVGEDVECKECEGEGEVEWEFNGKHRTYHKENTCPLCDGDGLERKSFMKKTGRQVPNPLTKHKMFGVGFLHGQLQRLIDASKIMGVETITKTFGQKSNGNMFTVGNATVLIMPALIEDWDDEFTVVFEL